MMSPERAAVREVMRKQAKVKNVYEAITMEMLTIANKAAVNPLKHAEPSTDYGYAGAHIEGEINATINDQQVDLSYALDVYWTGKKGVVAIVVLGRDQPLQRPSGPVNDDIEFSGRDDTAKVAKRAQDLLFHLRGKV